MVWDLMQKKYGTLSKNEIVTVLEFNAGQVGEYKWAKITRANGTIGYVANKYLIKCNDTKEGSDKIENTI